MQQPCYLVTGSAGFVGFHLSQKLLNNGARVIGIDNINNYYLPKLKRDRNQELLKSSSYVFFEKDICDEAFILKIFSDYQFDSVFHLAAQAGVRYSLENPRAYLKTNIDGTLNILEAVRHLKIKPHLLTASSSSVYGLSKNYPFKETDSADQPVALYGATKRADELMAHAYSHLFDIRNTLLRFFTVYGPWGRPDMALFHFVKNILHGDEIPVFNHGDMIRDFTYVDDIVNGIILLDEKRKNESLPPYDVFNIGCGRPISLMEYIHAIEKALNKKARLKMLPFQPGDIYKTYADLTKLNALTGFQPKTSVEDGVKKFVDWYLSYE